MAKSRMDETTPAGPSPSPTDDLKLKEQRTKTIKHREFEEVIQEEILNHPYFQDQMTLIFIILTVLLTLDISVLQNMVQLIICFAILLMMISWVVISNSLKS
jgi:hypothetical protein